MIGEAAKHLLEGKAPALAMCAVIVYIGITDAMDATGQEVIRQEGRIATLEKRVTELEGLHPRTSAPPHVALPN